MPAKKPTLSKSRKRVPRTIKTKPVECTTNHFDVQAGDYCPRCGKLVSRDEMEREIGAPESKIIDITPVGCQTPEGNARVNKAMKAFEDSTAAVANVATEFLAEQRLLLLEFASGSRPVGTRHELAALREDLHQLEALIGARRRKQEELLRAVAGAYPTP